MFEAARIQEMENLILGALEWRMRSITPFSFLHFFISLTEIDLKYPPSTPSKQALKKGSSDIIFNAHYGTNICYCVLLVEIRLCYCCIYYCVLLKPLKFCGTI